MNVLGHDRREGLGKRADSRVGLFLLILVSLLLLLSSLYSAEASVIKKAREAVIDVAAPVLEVLSGPIAFVQNAIGNVRDYFNVLEQNQALREENAELRQWMNEALALREILSRYERLQAYYAPLAITPVDAFVIGESNDAFTHSMIVNAGAGDGVARGQAVVDDVGLVGRIVDAGASASRILLLTDIQSRVPVYIEDANLEGILVGRTKARPSISFTESSDPVDFAPGQRVLTSGAGGVLPRGLPVGVIIDERDGEAIIDLYANYARTRMVRVINYAFPNVESAPEDALSAEAPPPVTAPPVTAPPMTDPPVAAGTGAPEPIQTEPIQAEPIQTDDEGPYEPVEAFTPPPAESLQPAAPAAPGDLPAEAVEPDAAAPAEPAEDEI